jgi:hypothetical protein
MPKDSDYNWNIYKEDGLDCSHVGIVIKVGVDKPLFRHASSQASYNKVIR